MGTKTNLGLLALLSIAGCFASTDVPPDTSPPQLQFDTPHHGDGVSGTINIEVTAFDDYSVERVQIFIDGTLRGTFYARPYFLRWNTTGLPSGSTHTLRAEGIDPSENKGSVEITVTVQQGGPS